MDSETHEPLEDVMLSCSCGVTIEGKIVTVGSTLYTDSTGTFHFFSNSNGHISLRQIGYYTKEIAYLAFSDSRKDTVDLGNLFLKPSEVLMKTIKVEGRARRFAIKGDTIVFNPSAFHLEGGARLEDLIIQLPGVESKEGNLYWNGKLVRLLMNGETLFGGKDLMGQIPAEAVESIMAYNKASEFSERTGKDDGGEDMVLDVKIKKNFLDKLYGDVNGTFQTKKYFDALANIQRLSEDNPVIMTASANNLNKQRHQTMRGISSNFSKDFGIEQYGAAGYQHNWKRSEGAQTLKSNWSLSGGAAHNDRWGRSHKDVENFFPGETYNYITEFDYHHRHAINPNAEATFRHAMNARNTFSLKATFDHKRLRERSEHRSAQFDSNPYQEWQEPLTVAFDSLSPRSLQVRNQTLSTSRGHSTDVGASASWTHYINDGSLTLSTTMDYNERLRDGVTERLIEYNDGAQPLNPLSQKTHTPTNSLTADVSANIQKWLGKKVLIKASYKYQNQSRRDLQDFYENGIVSMSNSYDDRYIGHSHFIDISSTINLGSFKILPGITWEGIREHEDYSRGTVDTTATRHTLLWHPQMKISWKITKSSALEMKYDQRTTQPDLKETIRYRDDSNPLYVHEGNVHLENSHRNNLSLALNSANSQRQRIMNIILAFQINDRVQQLMQTYNSQTNVYTIRPEMVKGRRLSSLIFNFDQGLGNEFRLRNSLSFQHDVTYGLLTRTNDAEPLFQNRRNSFLPSENIKLSYDHLWLKCSIFTAVTMNRLRFSLSPQHNTTIWNGRAGLDLEVEWKHLRIATNLTEFIRHGYIIKRMNDSFLLWNASATWKFLNNKARLSLEVNDILNQFDTFNAQEGAYQNIYSWRDQLHHYANVSFSYYFDAKKK